MVVLEGVTKTYRPGDAPALAGVSLQVAAGEVVAVLGPSGAGKSTLLRCLNGLVRTERGRIWVGGTEVTTLPASQLRQVRRRIGMIFQEFHLIDRLSVLENVLSGRLGRYSFCRGALHLWRPGDVADARRLLGRVELAGLEGALARELSGGQRQRVAVARAMMQDPQILLGDEPVASLDPVTARAILELLVELSRERGLATLLSLHDVSLARAYATRAVGLRGGQVVYDGPVDGLSAEVLGRIYSPSAPVPEVPADGRPAAASAPQPTAPDSPEVARRSRAC